MADVQVETFIHRYPAAELWEEDRWYVRLRFDGKYWSKDGWFHTQAEAVKLAQDIASDLGGTYRGEK